MLVNVAKLACFSQPSTDRSDILFAEAGSLAGERLILFYKALGSHGRVFKFLSKEGVYSIPGSYLKTLFDFT